MDAVARSGGCDCIDGRFGVCRCELLCLGSPPPKFKTLACAAAEFWILDVDWIGIKNLLCYQVDRDWVKKRGKGEI